MSGSPFSQLAQHGQASVEYLVGCLVVLALLWADSATGQSAVSLLLRSVRAGFARFASALSMT